MAAIHDAINEVVSSEPSIDAVAIAVETKDGEIRIRLEPLYRARIFRD